MEFKKSRLILALATILGLSSAQAQDARSLAMGGTGIASAYGTAAGLMNPALLKKKQLKFDAVVGVSIEASDFEDSADSINKLADTAKSLERDINSVAGTGIAIGSSSPSVSQISDSASEFNKRFKKLDGGLIGFVLNPLVGITYNCADCNYAFGLLVDNQIQGAVSAQIAGNDTDKFQNLVDATADGVIDASDASALTAFGLGTSGGGNFTFNTFDAQSKIIAAVAARQDIALPVARHFETQGNAFSMGVTPKFVQVAVFDKIGKVNEFNDSDENIKEKSTLTFDVGAHYELPDTDFSVGAVVKDLIGTNLEAANGATVQIAPQLKVGTAYEKQYFTLAADLDLNESELIKDSGQATQFLSLGAEATYNRWISLRLGYQNNLASDSSVGNRTSIGFGVLKNVLQLSAFVGEEDEKGIALQSNISF